MTLLSAGRSWIASAVHTAAAQAAVYHRGETSVTLTSGAVPAKPQTGLIDPESGAVVEWDGQDFLIVLAELSALGEPLKGDLLVVDGDTYQVQPPSGDKCFEFVGGRAGAVQYRVHTKVIES